MARSFARVLALLAGLAFPAAASGQSVDIGALMTPPSLAEQSFGNANAPVTVIEYFSPACHFCANFHAATWPAFKAKYVDTGKVRFILRDFPNDLPGLAAAMLARCAGEGRWYETIDRLFREQDVWTHASNVGNALAEVARAGGMNREQFDACMLDKPLYENVRAAVLHARDRFGVASTPTFFINGEKHVGALTIEQFDRILAPMLK